MLEESVSNKEGDGIAIKSNNQTYQLLYQKKHALKHLERAAIWHHQYYFKQRIVHWSSSSHCVEAWWFDNQWAAKSSIDSWQTMKPLHLHAKVVLNLCSRVKDIHWRYDFACCTRRENISYMTRWHNTSLTAALQWGIVIHNRAWPAAVSCHWKIMMRLVHILNSTLHVRRLKVQFRNKDFIGILYLLANTTASCNKIELCIDKPATAGGSGE